MTAAEINLVSARTEIARLQAEGDVTGLRYLRDKAGVIAAYARRNDARDAANDAGEIKVRAERALGHLDRTANPHGGNRNGQVSGTGNLLNVRRETRAAWRKLSKLADDTFQRYVDLARDDEEAGVSTAQLIRIGRLGGAVSSTTFETYTPAVYVDAAREVMGGIDLDPASSAEANDVVQAARIHTVDDDGLAHDWSGRVWLNPPYGRGLTSQFVAKANAEYDAGRVTAAVLCLNAYGFDAAWFVPLWNHTLCFTDHRIRFYGEGGPTFGSLFAYLGPDPHRFAAVFIRFGVVVRRWP